MDFFPAFLRLRDRACLLVGGGSVAARKAQLLLAAGARVTVVAPQIGTTIAGLVAAGRVHHIPRKFNDADVRGHWLVVCATGRVGVRQAVLAAAERAGVYCNSVDNGGESSFITPAIVDRGPVVVAISSGGAAPVLARIIRKRIEALLPHSIGRLAVFARGWRARVNSRLASLLAKRRFWERFFDGPVASFVHANKIDAANEQAASLLDNGDDAVANSGAAWLVGAGPGDPGLLTLRALQVMQSADVIVHDRLVSAEVLALARRDADLIPVGKAPGCRQNSQEEINDLLVGLVESGLRVCRLKGGDPFIFGRGGEEAAALAAAGAPFEVIPGITAAAGCAASAGIPLTHRDAAQAVVFLTAHGKDSIDRLDWASLARDRQTLAVYMGVQRFPDLMRQLVMHGRSAETPVAIVENGTRIEQRVIRGRLGRLSILAEEHDIVSPAMLFIGEVAGLAADQSDSGLLGTDAAYLRESAIQKAVNQ